MFKQLVKWILPPLKGSVWILQWSGTCRLPCRAMRHSWSADAGIPLDSPSPAPIPFRRLAAFLSAILQKTPHYELKHLKHRSRLNEWSSGCCALRVHSVVCDLTDTISTLRLVKPLSFILKAHNSEWNKCKMISGWSCVHEDSCSTERWI